MAMLHGCVATLALTSACSSEGNSLPKVQSMKASASVFDLIPRLVEKLPFQQQDVANLIGVMLTRDVQTSTSAYDIYRSTGAKGPISSVEVRQPVAAKPGKYGIVILEVAPEPCFKTSDVIARYGDPADLSIPSTHHPPDAPQYYVYKQTWGVLRLGFARTEPACLTTLVLDAT